MPGLVRGGFDRPRLVGGALSRQISRDSTEERRLYVRAFLDERPLARLLYRMSEALPAWLTACAAALYAASLGAVRTRRLGSPLAALYRYPNEEKAVALVNTGLASGFEPVRWPGDRLDHAFAVFWFFRAGLRDRRFARRAWRLCLRLLARHELYVALRALNTLAACLFLREAWRLRRPGAVLIATDGNPHGNAALAACRDLGIPVVFASTGAVSIGAVPIEADVGVFYGPRGADQYKERGASFGAVRYYGFRERSRPIEERAGGSVLVCLPPAPCLRGLGSLLVACAAYPEVVLRMHPSTMVSADSMASLCPGARISSGGSVFRDLAEARVCLAGDSTVHMDALLAGVVSLFIPALEPGTRDRLEFLREDPLVAAGEGRDLEGEYRRALAFYRTPGWRRRFNEYVNTEETAEESMKKLGELILRLSRGEER